MSEPTNAELIAEARVESRCLLAGVNWPAGLNRSGMLLKTLADRLEADGNQMEAILCGLNGANERLGLAEDRAKASEAARIEAERRLAEAVAIIDRAKGYLDDSWRIYEDVEAFLAANKPITEPTP